MNQYSLSYSWWLFGTKTYLLHRINMRCDLSTVEIAYNQVCLDFHAIDRV